MMIIFVLLFYISCPWILSKIYFENLFVALYEDESELWNSKFDHWYNIWFGKCKLTICISNFTTKNQLQIVEMIFYGLKVYKIGKFNIHLIYLLTLSADIKVMNELKYDLFKNWKVWKSNR